MLSTSRRCVLSRVLVISSRLIAMLLLAACDGGGTSSGSSSSSSSSQDPVNQVPEWAIDSTEPVKNVVTTTVKGAVWASAADLDGDGDQDLLSASSPEETIAWYESDGMASPEFTERLIPISGDGVSSVFSSDLDKDGDLDILLESWGSMAFYWYKNDGAVDPSFSASEIFGNKGPKLAADLDGDGDQDLVHVSSNDAYWDGLEGAKPYAIGWRENDGMADPEFAWRWITTSAERVVSLVAADVDDDGDLDLLAAWSNDKAISWFENDGAADPEFVERSITTAPNDASSMYVADVDGDGDLDLLTVSYNDDTIAWYENDGAAAPVFTQRVITTGADGAISAFAKDVDGDGDLDVLLARSKESDVTWYENDGAVKPTFVKRMIPAAVDGTHSVFGSDLDGDGDLELLSASATDDTLAWYRLAGRLHWVAEGETLSVIESATDPDGDVLSYAISHGADAGLFSIDSATGELIFVNAPPLSSPQDVNGDNIYEVWISVADGVSTINRSLAVWVYVDVDDDDDDGVPDSEDAFPLDPSESMDTDMDGTGNNQDSDDDGDGVDDDTDHAPLDASSALAPEWLQPYQQPQRQLIEDKVGQVTSVSSADLNGDGYKDLLAAWSNSNTIAWYENSGAADPEFAMRATPMSATEARSVFAADLDQDGDMDVLSASYWDGIVAWHENDGAANPVFDERLIGYTFDALLVFAADLDGDGDPDVLTAAEDGGLSWYENDGTPNPEFIEHRLPISVRGAQSMHAADVDGDGDLDLLSTSYSIMFEERHAWYENNGAEDPEFTRQPIGDLESLDIVFAADLDGDGDLDLLLTSKFDDPNTIAWYENDGATDPEFAMRVITSTAGDESSVFAADLDGDGDMDVLSTEEHGAAIVWFENDGAVHPTFVERRIPMEDDGARSVYVADVDGDEALDLVLVSARYGTIAWYPTTQRRYQVAEGQTLEVLENASDLDGNLLTYAISHGPDAAFFTIDATEGELTFANAPLVSAPEDANGDNVYEVWISVSDGFSTLNRSVAVEVQPAN